MIAALLIPSSVLKPLLQEYLLSSPVYCSPPNTVIGIETRLEKHTITFLPHCSPPNTVIGIETFSVRFGTGFRGVIAALLIPSSVLKQCFAFFMILLLGIAALLIPSSVLKHLLVRLVKFKMNYCSPPNTVIGIETYGGISWCFVHILNCSPPNTVIGIETIYRIRACFS